MSIMDHHLYEVSVKFHDSVIITNLPTRTKDGLVYLLTVEKSWRWGCEIKLIYEHFLAKEIKYYRYIPYKGEKVFESFINNLYDKRIKT